jgi:hypothetical protein
VKLQLGCCNGNLTTRWRQAFAPAASTGSTEVVPELPEHHLEHHAPVTRRGRPKRCVTGFRVVGTLRNGQGRLISFAKVDVEGSNPFSRSNAGPLGPALLPVTAWLRDVNASRVRRLRRRPYVYPPSIVARGIQSPFGPGTPAQIPSALLA